MLLHDFEDDQPTSFRPVRTLRDYQDGAIKGALRELLEVGVESTLIVLPTGMGKTVIFSRMASEWDRGNVLILAHRIELLDQAADKLRDELGYRPPIEQGMRGMDEDAIWQGGNVVVGSVQTMRNVKRMRKYRDHPFGLVIVDEAHHAVSASYRRIIEQCLEMNPSCKILGVTATPNRADEAALGIVFGSVAYGMDLKQGIDLGWLVDIRQEFIHLDEDSVDFSNLRLVKDKMGESDFRREELEQILTEENALHAMSKPILDRSQNGEQCLIFNAGVAHAHLMAAVLNRYKDQSAAAVDGKTDKDERRKIVESFQEGKLKYLCNFGVFCLDSETEILTSDGWTGIDDMTYQHEVANWDNGTIFFECPKFIIRRDRLPGEKMVVLDTPRRSIRVTEDHRMLYRTYDREEFRIKHAGELVGERAFLPVSGIALPMSVRLDQPKADPNRSRRIAANSYCLRKKGMSPSEAKHEATARIDARDSLRYTEPHELTEEDCEFIGFWIGDGSRCQVQKGGVEYTVAQSPNYSKIVERIDWLLEKIGTNFIKRRVLEGQVGDHFRWSMPRGTGFGPQKRDGLFRLEPYLDKSGTNLFWAFSDIQFFALLRGLWMADGEHGNSINPPDTLNACGINIDLFDIIQAVGTCRGYRVTVHPQKVRAAHHTPLLKLSARRADSHQMTTHRLRVEDGWTNERVWCVTSTTGNIITRRKGSVTVTGNTEGFDCPATSLVVMARPTKSVSLYIQMLGRGTRPLGGVVDGPPDPDSRRAAILASRKPYMTVLDFVGNSRHKPCSVVDALGGDYDIEVRELAEERIREKGGDVKDALEDAKVDAALYADEAKRKAVKAKSVVYTSHNVDVFSGAAAPVVSGNTDVPRGGSTEGQIGLLVGLGVVYATAAGYSKRQAGAVIESLSKTRCTVKQANILKKYGFPPMPMKEASKVIDQIAANGWRRP
jgi:superfamily II DNA or RNA helicase